MNKQNAIISIITPTYNRAGTLSNCFQSLLAQTDYRFEWIVIDDGSTDSTKEVMETVQSDITLPFSIIYHQKKNGGKHTALNASHEFITGKYILILDSDDSLTSDAVEKAIKAWDCFDNNQEIGIVIFLKGRDPEHPNCYVEEDGCIVDFISQKRICKESNDACEIIRKELFINNPFPVFPGEKFVSESALWNTVSATHKCVYINHVIYLCEYLEDGLTKAGRSLRIKNPHGGMFTANLNMSKKRRVYERIKNGMLYVCYSRFARISLKAMLHASDYKLLAAICIPPGLLLFLFWREKYNRKKE